MDFGSLSAIFIQIILAVGMCCVIILASHLFGQRAKTNELKDSAYECGIKPIGKAHPKFSIKFYLVAMLFVVFDIEVVFMLPLALIYSDFVSSNIYFIFPAMVFVSLLIIGLIYEIKKGALDWHIPRTNE